MANERKTETLIRSYLRRNNYFNDPDIRVEEQKSEFPRINKLFKYASKKGDGAGYPDFIISSGTYTDFLIIIECKADETKHISKNKDRYAEYAVDGVLLYADFLSKDFDMLAIAVSGETESTLRISHHLHLKGSPKALEFLVSGILSFGEYYEKVNQSEGKVRQDYDAILAYSRDLNEDLQVAKIKETDRGLLICGILVALRNEAFKKSFSAHNTAKELAESLVNSILNEFQYTKLSHERIVNLEGAFSFIKRNTTL